MNALSQLVGSLADLHPQDAARMLEAMDTSEAGQVLEALPGRALGRVMEKLSPGIASETLGQLGADRTRELIESLPARQAAAILAHLDTDQREATLAGIPGPTARRLRGLAEHVPGTAGSLMDVQITVVRNDRTVEEAIGTLRRAPRQTLTYLYVVDADDVLTGVLNTRDLLLAEPAEPITNLTRPVRFSLGVTATQQEVAEAIETSRFVALPVVDIDGHLLGVVRHEQAMDAVRESAFGDLQKMVGAGSDERALSPVSVVVKKRLPWLYVNLLTAFLAAAVVGLFESTIQQVTALAVLLPVVAGQGGNTGAQALAVVMRGIALREVLPGTVRQLAMKELYGALFNGAAIAVVCSAAVLLWDGRLALAAVIGFSMVVNMVCAALAGTAIPLVLKALGRDPAQSSSIFMTTVTDIVGFASFLGFALLMMPWLTS